MKKRQRKSQRRKRFIRGEELSIQNEISAMLINKSNLIQKIKESDMKIILTIGAGDIGEEVKNIKQALLHAS